MKSIKVLGSGCANCKTTLKLIEEVAQARGVAVNLEKVEDMAVTISHEGYIKRNAVTLYRAQRTLMEVVEATGHPHYHEAESHDALNERDYGDFTGKNKWQVKEEVGEERFTRIRRHFAEPIPNGETLRDVYERVVPYFAQRILPKLVRGENVLVVAHGNSLRALAKYIEEISDEGVADLEIGTGEAHCYEFDRRGRYVGKQIRGTNEKKGKV